MSKDWLDQVLTKSEKSSLTYKMELVESLLNIINSSYQPSCRIRLITLEISLELLVSFTKPNTDECCITESQQHSLFLAQCQAMNALRNFYMSEEIFLDLFEDEYNEMKKSVLNVEYLCMDSTILLPPTGTPLTGIGFTRRLPCGEVEKARRAIRGFFLLRRTCQKFLNETETMLPLTNYTNCVHVDNVLDLNNSDLIACTVIIKDSTKQRRFLVIDTLQLILVEPDAKLLGWGVAKFVGFLQDVEVVGDKDDSRCLHITVHRGGASHNRTPLLSANFLFDDHIRCMAAKQRLTKGRSKARQKKMYQIAQLLEMPDQFTDSSVYSVSRLRSGAAARTSREHKAILSSSRRVPGFAAALKRENVPISGVSRIQMVQNRSVEGFRTESRSRRRGSNSSSCSSTPSNETFENSFDRKIKSQSQENSTNRYLRPRESNPRVSWPRSEEIPLEDFQHSKTNGQHFRSSSNPPSRSHTPLKSKYETTSPQITLPNSNDVTKINGITSCMEVVAVNSEETSFIAKEHMERHQGTIETV